MLNFIKKIFHIVSNAGKPISDSITYFNKGMGNEDRAELFRVQGLARMKKGDFSEAVKKFEMALALYFNSAQIHADKACAHLGSNDYKEALKEVGLALKLDEKFVYAYETRALIKQKLKDFEGSKKDYEYAKTLREKRTFEDTRELKTSKEYTRRGSDKIEKGDHPGAIEDLNKAILLDPENVDAYLNRGSLRQSMDDYEGAKSDFLKAKKLQGGTR